MDRHSEDLRRIVFVGGSPRSGTTLVQRLLNYHPAVYGGPEFDFVPEIAELYRRMLRSIHLGRIDCIVDEVTLTRAFRTLLVSLLIPKAEAEGVRIFSEKTPSNVLAFDVIERLAPESKRIVVIRDPRDVVKSMLEVGRRKRQRCGHTDGFIQDIVAAVSYMNECLLAGAAAAERRSGCLVVYFEDVIADPIVQANRIYAFLGLELIDRLELEKVDFDMARNKASWIDWCAPEVMKGEIAADRVGAGRSGLTSAELSYIAANVMSHHLIREKYDLGAHAGASAGVGWCRVKTAAQRLKEHTRALPALILRKLFR